jgi:NADH-quinone oxidoreductase subunit H
MNRTPFDLPEAESELVSGYNTEYSGMKFALFFLAEYAATFIMSVFTVVLFLGGYTSPLPGYISDALLSMLHVHTPIICAIANTFEQLGWLLGKTYAVIITIMWVRATLPRFRVDHMMGFSWKVLLPISLVNLLIVAAYKLVFP